MNRNRILKLSVLGIIIAGTTLAHFTVGTTTHSLHVLHVVFRGFYLLAVIVSGVWFGLKGGLLSSALVSVVYGIHILVSWSNNPMENVNQVAMIGVYIVLGNLTGLLVDLQEREKQERVRTERRLQKEAIIQGFSGLSYALKARDEETRNHSENVARLSVVLGDRCGLNENQLEDLRLAALVHDIGKIGIRDDILFKEEKLSPEERKAMEEHPKLAAEILKPIKGTERIAEIVLCHHECLDGSGYPRGLDGDDIPVEAKILSVADVYCALTEDRPYKKGMEPEKALEILRQMAGNKLEKEYVAQLGNLLQKPNGEEWPSSVKSHEEAILP